MFKKAVLAMCLMCSTLLPAYAESPHTEPLLQFAQAQPEQGTLINYTGLNKSTAIGLSILPGAGQLYAGDLSGLFYLLGVAALIGLDAGVYYGSGKNNRITPILLGIPALSVASMIQAGTQTQEISLINIEF